MLFVTMIVFVQFCFCCNGGATTYTLGGFITPPSHRKNKFGGCGGGDTPHGQTEYYKKVVVYTVPKRVTCTHIMCSIQCSSTLFPKSCKIEHHLYQKLLTKLPPPFLFALKIRQNCMYYIYFIFRRRKKWLKFRDKTSQF